MEWDTTDLFVLIHVQPNVFRRCIQKWTQNQAPGFPGSGRLYGVTLVPLQTGYAAAAAANTIQVLSSVLQCAFTILHVTWMYASAICMETSHFNGHYYIPSWHIYIVVVYLFCMSLGRVRSKEPRKLLDFRAALFHSFSRSSLSLSSTTFSSTGQRSHGNCWISGQPGLTSASLAPRHLSKASSVSL